MMDKIYNKILNMWKHELTREERDACDDEANGWLYIIELFIAKHPEYNDELNKLVQFKDKSMRKNGFTTIDKELKQLCITLQQSLYTTFTLLEWINTLRKLPDSDGLYLVVTASGAITQLHYSVSTRCFNGSAPILVAFWAKQSDSLLKISDEAFSKNHLLDDYYSIT